ncbi:polysialyltransferase family glycosyltransferase [Streptomyces sp. PR69]|uniref:polysialyltransferase family glycosyltransferase n=1 Tax=Streptomyces sp. PR69 TaxID=2984950 RepID=UPI002265576D|nr:polysialyltransferase family glycosyltransferase [Streptomyces sp. PR69]
MTVQIFSAAGPEAAAVLTASLRSGLFGPRSEHRRVLVVSDVSPAPELSTPLDRLPGSGVLTEQFDEVRSWNETIHPHHPAGWSPRHQDIPLWEKSLRLAWRLGGERVEVVCDSVSADPSRAIAAIFADSPVHVYAGGLTAYGPTPSRVRLPLSSRIRRLLHVDLAPGVRPLLLSECGVEPVAVPESAIRAVLSELGAAAGADAGGSTALLLGPAPSVSEGLGHDEAQALRLRMVRAAAALGHRAIAVQPGPGDPADAVSALASAAAGLEVTLTALPASVPAEAFYERARPALVVGCSPTALLTAAALYGIPAARVGTELLLERIAPYQHPDRAPLTIADVLLPDAETDGRRAGQPVDLADASAEQSLEALLRAVAYCMQSESYPHLRPEAESLLAVLPPDRLTRYFKRHRLTGLGLPGGRPVRAAALRRHPAVRKVVRKLR